MTFLQRMYLSVSKMMRLISQPLWFAAYLSPQWLTTRFFSLSWVDYLHQPGIGNPFEWVCVGRAQRGALAVSPLHNRLNIQSVCSSLLISQCLWRRNGKESYKCEVSAFLMCQRCAVLYSVHIILIQVQWNQEKWRETGLAWQRNCDISLFLMTPGMKNHQSSVSLNETKNNSS